MITGQFWDISTGHIRSQDMNLLGLLGDQSSEMCKQMQDRPTFTVANYPEGSFVSVLNEPEVHRSLVACGFSPEFIRIYGAAILRGVRLIWFDRDGPTYHRLPQFH